MPFLDGTGPNGAGPRTGRGMGRCSGYTGNVPWGARGYGRGFGRGYGRGYGYGWRYAQAAPVDEEAELKSEATYLEERLAAIKARLAQLLGKKKTEE